jgi:hypothetical protein
LPRSTTSPLDKPPAAREDIAMGEIKAIVLLAALVAASSAGAAKPKLPPYPEALRCAALTEAWTKQVEVLSDEGRKRFDAALFWGLAASDSARHARLTSAKFKQDQLDAGAVAAAEIAGNDARAAAELRACVARVPPLKP